VTKKTQADFLDLVTNAKGTNRAISFFAIQGKPTPDGFNFSPSKDFFVFEASGSRAKELLDIHQQVALVPSQEKRDWTQEQGIPVFSLHLKDLLRPTDISDIDDKPTLWQLNWAEVVWPAFRSDSITTKEGDRLWFQTSVRDFAGVHNDIWMNQHSALKLSRAEDKGEFIQAWKNGDQLFPILASLKILRSMHDVLALDGAAMAQGVLPIQGSSIPWARTFHVLQPMLMPDSRRACAFLLCCQCPHHGGHTELQPWRSQAQGHNPQNWIAAVWRGALPANHS
jgi:hypothetical protein